MRRPDDREAVDQLAAAISRILRREEDRDPRLARTSQQVFNLRPDAGSMPSSGSSRAERAGWLHRHSNEHFFAMPLRSLVGINYHLTSQKIETRSAVFSPMLLCPLFQIKQGSAGPQGVSG